MSHLIISLVGVAVSFLSLSFVFYARPSRVHNAISATLALIFMYFLCNIWQEMSASVGGWTVSMQFTYIVSVLNCYVLGVTLTRIIGDRLPRWQRIIALVIVLICMGIFATIGCSRLYFSEIIMIENPANANLFIFETVKGPLYTVANVLIIVLTLLMLIPVFVRLYHVKGYGVVFIKLILVTGLMNPVFFAISHTGLVSSMYTNAFANILFTLLLAYIQVKYDLAMSVSVAKDTSIDNLSEGLLIFNRYGHLIYHNNQAEQIMADCDWNQFDKTYAYLRENVLGRKIVQLRGEPYEVRETEFKQGGFFGGTIVWIVNTSEQTRLILQEERALRTEELLHQSVTALATAIDAKDRYTNGHSLRVAVYSKMIADRMGKSAEYTESIYLHAILHDIGKIGIPDGIINKVDSLTQEEYDIIKAHSVKGYEILSGITSHPTWAQTARSHHERYDGKGYPDGLRGTEIPEMARIIAVADSYDAMSSNRSYRNYMSQSAVEAEIRRCRGTQFDPVIADIWLEIMAEDRHYELREHAGN